jgi:flagellar hook-basal body complex protein FliE
MHQVSQMSGVAQAGNVAAKASATVPAMPFANVLRSVAQQTSDLDMQAQSAVTGLLSGQGVEIHQAMMATQKSEMAFEMALQVRNKAVAAYQQMMTMQF